MQITIAAFATIDDIRDWITPFAEKTPLYFALVVYFPYRVIPLTHWDHFVKKTSALRANELWIDLVPIPASRRGKIDPKYKNRERFIVNLPEFRKIGLCEANFGTVATKEKHLKVWRAIIRAVRKRTIGGMWIWNNIHRTKGFSNRQRYSPNVAALHAKGLNLMPFAGGNDVFIDEPREGL